MTLDYYEAPDCLLELIAWLLGKQFILIRSDKVDTYNQYGEYAFRNLRIKISETRGEWSVELALAGMYNYHSPIVWEAVLNDSEVPLTEPSLCESVVFAKTRWIKMAERYSSAQECETLLQDASDSWARRQFNLPETWTYPRNADDEHIS